MKKEENCKPYRMTHYGKQPERKLKYKHVFDILHICIKLPCSEQQETEDYNVKKIRYIRTGTGQLHRTGSHVQCGDLSEQ